MNQSISQETRNEKDAREEVTVKEKEEKIPDET